MGSRWRIVDLHHWIFEEFRIGRSRQTLSRALRAMGYRKLSARPRRHARGPDGAIEDFTTVRQPQRDRERQKGVDEAIEIGFADEARIGHFRRDPSEGGQGRRPRHAPLRRRGDEPARGRDRDADRVGARCWRERSSVQKDAIRPDREGGRRARRPHARDERLKCVANLRRRIVHRALRRLHLADPIAGPLAFATFRRPGYRQCRRHVSSARSRENRLLKRSAGSSAGLHCRHWGVQLSSPKRT